MTPAGEPPAGGTAARRARLEAERATSARTRRTPEGDGATPGRAAPAVDQATRRALDPDRLAALEEERDFLLGSLDDLEREHDAGDLDEDDYLELKDDYTARAAAVLRAIEDRGTTMAAVRGPRRPGRTWLLAALVLVVAAVLGVAVAQASGRRAPGEAATGDTRQSTRDKLLEAQSFIGEANAALQEGRADQSVESFRAALSTYDEVLATSPENVEALTYRGWLFHQLAVLAADGGGQTASDLDQKATADLDRAIAIDPGYPDAHIFRAILYRNAGDPRRALAELDQVAPEDIPPFMQQMVDGLRAGLTGSTAGTTPGSTAAR